MYTYNRFYIRYAYMCCMCVYIYINILIIYFKHVKVYLYANKDVGVWGFLRLRNVGNGKLLFRDNGKILHRKK